MKFTSTKLTNSGFVEFQFFPPNHSVARAEYGFPCIPYELTGENKVGFFSGFHPVDVILDNNVGPHSSSALVSCAKYSLKPPTWNLTINDTEPIFYYCSAPGSCINFAMVGVINPVCMTTSSFIKLANDFGRMPQYP